MRPLVSMLGTVVLLVAVSLVFQSTDPAHAAKGRKGGGGGGGGDPLTLFDFTVSPDNGLIGDLIDMTWKVQNNTNKPVVVEMFTVIDSDSQRMKKGCGMDIIIPAGQIFWGGVVGEAGILCGGGEIDLLSGSVHQIGVRAVLKDRKGNPKFTARGDVAFTFLD